MLGYDIGFDSRGYLASYFKDKYNIPILHNATTINYSDSNTDINEQVKVSTNFIYINSREEKNLHIEITNIDLAKGKSLQKFANSFDPVFTQASYRKNDVFLLRLCSIKGQKNSYDSLIKFNSICSNKSNQDVREEDPKCIYGTLKEEINKYCRHNHILQSDVKLTLINLCAFNKLKFDTNDLEKYIQFKNEELSYCTEEELNEQAEKFINPHSYPHYFRDEISKYLGRAIAEKIKNGVYTKAVANPLILPNNNVPSQISQISSFSNIFMSSSYVQLGWLGYQY
ncbi:MAG: hypothetical protein sL5_07030 [Candidatus Mesenet longicola]|uniref:Uncharacterized protein n=1 Tax=Candidatus Mesenet longicola TaxID=1892558 RepID=A0A8J3HVJ8_9RICK|nr:MAG: hypothetical protein sGL2_07410 [Candidatus Mesenet longicola]GHM59710.1 MAG: hypothetical protein sL5_07030 [Candidatus Mesenet longicola]